MPYNMCTGGNINNPTAGVPVAPETGAVGYSRTGYSTCAMKACVENNFSMTPRSPLRCTPIHLQYRVIKLIGQGTYGVVYKAKDQETKQIVGLKRCRLETTEDAYGIPETALREVTLLHDLKHDNVMSLYRISCNAHRVYMVCEYLDLDLKQYLREHPNGIPIRKVKKITYALLKGLAFCHGHRVIHRDLKPHNVLVSADASVVKIADFGLACSYVVPGKTLTHEVVTLWYRAPELLLGHCNYTSGIDIWSVGCVVAELLNNRPLYPGDSEIDTLFKIFYHLGTPEKVHWPEHAVVKWEQFPTVQGQAKPFASLSAELDEEGQDSLTRIFRFRSSDRLSAVEALHHPWLREVAGRDAQNHSDALCPEHLYWANGRTSDRPQLRGILFSQRLPTSRRFLRKVEEGPRPAAVETLQSCSFLERPLHCSRSDGPSCRSFVNVFNYFWSSFALTLPISKRRVSTQHTTSATLSDKHTC